MLLTKFALKAKNQIGAIKVSEIFNDELYAFDMLARASMANDSELVDLSLKISYEFEIGFNLVNAMKTYIYNVKEFNGDHEFSLKSKTLLIQFSNYLYGIPISGASYRHAVAEFLSNIDNGEKTFFINLARKFYRYWRASNKPILEIHKKMTFKQIDQKKAFNKLWDNIDKEFFSHLEMCVLTHYAESMLDKGLAEKDILISVRIAKIITIELRNDQIITDESYRDAIHRSDLLFQKEELKKLFLIVSREFYHFWIGNITKTLSVA